MIKKRNNIKKYAQIHYSLNWNQELLERIKDYENLKLIQNIREEYKYKIFDLMKELNLKEVDIDVTKTVTVTFSMK